MKLVRLCMLLFALILFSCREDESGAIIQKQKLEPTQLVEDELIYELINTVLDDKDCKYVFDKEPLPYFLTEADSSSLKIDSIFNSDDLNFIYNQALYSQKYVLKQRLLRGKELLQLDLKKVFEEDHNIRRSYWNKILKKYGATCFVRMPLFAVDKQTALISYGIHRGEGGLYIYGKKNGKWILVHTLNHWVS